MDAIEYLTEQHREIESLFDQFETAHRMRPKLRLWRKLADLLSVHKAIEERIFFRAVRDAGLEENLLRGLAEHASVEPLVAELVDMDEVTDEMVAKMAVLRRRKLQHAAAEEKELFPRVRGLLLAVHLQVLGRQMEQVAEHLMGPGARERLVAQVARA